MVFMVQLPETFDNFCKAKTSRKALEQYAAFDISILRSFTLDYEYDFRISNQWLFQSPRSSCWFYVERVARGMKRIHDVIM